MCCRQIFFNGLKKKNKGNKNLVFKDFNSKALKKK